MSIDMYLSESQSQASSAATMAESEAQAYEELEQALTAFIGSSDTLKGQAYDSARSYAEQMLQPLVQGGKMLSEAIGSAVQRFPEAYVEQVSSESLKESELLADIQSLETAISEAEETMTSLQKDEPSSEGSVRLASYGAVIGAATGAKSALESKLEKLRTFDRTSPDLFSDIATLQALVDTGIGQLSSGWDASRGVYVLPADLTWATQINTAVALKDMKLTAEEQEYLNNLMAQYGFDVETAKQIIQVKRGIDKKFPDMSQEERDYLLLRVLGSVSYGAVNGTKEELLWNMTAGSLGDYFYKEKSNASGNSVYREEMTFDEIMAELGLSDEGAKTLYKNLTLQHGLSGDDRDLNAMSESQLRQYAEEISTSYKNDKGIDITVDEVLKGIQNMYQKADFTHQSITMATHLRPSYYPLINDQVEDLAGWEGDTTKNANERDPSIAIDDYLADLDAVNIVNRMDSESGQSYMEAFNAYHKDLEKGKTSREAEFKQNVDVKEVKTTIFSSLIPNGLSGKVAGVDPTTGTIIYAPASEEEKMAYLKDNHEGSYNFIKSLEDEENQFE